MGIREKRKKIERSIAHIVESAVNEDYAMRELLRIQSFVEEQIQNLSLNQKQKGETHVE